MQCCKAKSFFLFVLAAALGGAISRAVPAWPQVTAQDHGDPRNKGVHATGPQHVTVRFLTGQQQSDVVGVPAVTGFAVEEMSGGKFLVLTSATGQRVYFAYDKVVTIDARPMGPAPEHGNPPPVAPK